MAYAQDEEPSERTQLLPAQQASRRPPLLRRKTLQSSGSIMVLMLIVVLLTSFGDQLKESPEARIIESVICYRYYENVDPTRLKVGRDVVGPGAIGGVDELYCKADAVQDELAMISGYQNFFDGFPALLLALPFGWAADRYGRWPFLFMGLIQIAMRTAWTQLVTWNWQAFDVRVTWFQSAFSVMGGGSTAITAYFFTVIADITQEQDRAAQFLRIMASNIAANLIMPPVAAALMTINPWIPSLLGTLLQLFAAALFLLVPETLDYHKRSCPERMPTTEEGTATTASTEPGPSGIVMSSYAKLRASLTFLTKDWRVSALIATFVAHILIANSGRLVLQYVSKRYALTFSKATLLVTIRQGITVLLLYVILPYLSKEVMRIYGLCSQTKDLYLARGSQILVVLGWTVVAASPNIPTVAISLSIVSLGSGSALFIRSFLTSLLPAHDIARVYSLIGIVDTLGLMFGAPLLADLFTKGLALGGGWVGLPFYFIGIVSMFFLGLLFIVGMKKSEGSSPDVDTAEQR